MKGKQRQKSPETRAQALALADDKGIAAAAKMAGVSKQTISNWRLAQRMRDKAVSKARARAGWEKTNGAATEPALPTNGAPVTGDALALLRADVVKALEQLDAMRPLFEQIQRMRQAFEGARP